MLELENVDAFYGKAQALHGVSLAIQDGARVAVLGRNGAGKSTLLKGIMNAGPTTNGQIRWKGDSLTDVPVFLRARKGLALVPEDRRIYSHLSVIENIAMAQIGARVERDPKRIEEIIRVLPILDPLRDRLGFQLSGGQQQLVAIARALAGRPSLLLLDEPTEGVAPVIVEEMAAAIVAACSATGTALMLCEQNIWFSRKCTTHLHILDTGRIVFSGSWADFDEAASDISKHLAV